MSFTANIIGTGQLGKTLGRLLVKQQLLTLVGIFNRNQERSRHALEFIGEGSIYPYLSDLPSADIYFITTSDLAIGEVAQSLCLNPNIQAGHIVVHCSGSLSSEILKPLKQKGCFIASIHPMHSFAEPEISVDHFAGTFCALEGDKEATEVLTNIFKALGAITLTINKEKKALYHSGAVFATNYLVTLSQQALFCLEGAGIEKKDALMMLIQMMKGTLSNLEKTQCPKASLTGPIKRGDVSTVQRHLSILDKELQKELYVALGKATLKLCDFSEEDSQGKDLLELFRRG